MFLKSNVVPDFIALHEGSIKGEKTQPTIELYPQDKYEWFGHVTSMISLSNYDKVETNVSHAGENRETSPLPWDPK